MIGRKKGFALATVLNTYRVGAKLCSSQDRSGARLRGPDSTQVNFNYLPKHFFAASQQPRGLTACGPIHFATDFSIFCSTYSYSPSHCLKCSNLCPLISANAWKSRTDPASVARIRRHWPSLRRFNPSFAFNKGNGQARPRASISSTTGLSGEPSGGKKGGMESLLL